MGNKAKQKTVNVRFEDGQESTFPQNVTLLKILESTHLPDKETIVLAKVNNRICNLHQKIGNDCSVQWIHIPSTEGMRSYQQTLSLVFIRAAKELYPTTKILIDHSLGNGLYCELKANKHPNHRMVEKIKNQMHKIIDKDEVIKPLLVSYEQAVKYFKDWGEEPPLFVEKEKLSNLTFYQCGKIINYINYPPFPSTGYIKSFDLHYWPPGVILSFPESSNIYQLPRFIKQKKLFRVFSEYGQWENILGIEKVNDINEAIKSGEIFDLIKIAEGLHEKKIVQIAEQITRKKKNVRIILIAGPSSSGKTTFAKRLNIQLRVNGLAPLAISLDDYFLDRDKTPKDKDGNYDFESPMAIDTFRLNEDLKKLMWGETVELPRYDFKEGKSIPGPKHKLKPQQPILIEGLHSLNSQITREIPRKNKLKIYVSALTQLNITDHIRVPTSDVRILRRLIRDYQFRDHSTVYTLEHWPLVRQGEGKYIFPFQEETDIIFNSSLVYELAVLRDLVQPLLEKVPENHQTFPEAQRLLELISYFLPIEAGKVPSNSILREFIGGSSFSY